VRLGSFLVFLEKLVMVRLDFVVLHFPLNNERRSSCLQNPDLFPKTFDLFLLFKDNRVLERKSCVNSPYAHCMAPTQGV
jgi:hypothetical protein